MILDKLTAGLAALDVEHLRRRRRIVDSPALPHLNADGKPWLSFCSNDYLGLANDPEIVEALCQGARQWGAGSGASHLVGGHLRPHEELENRVAEFVGMERALTFSTGYMANLAVTPALVGRGDAVFADRLNHASLIDAALASRAEHKRYAHNDVDMLDELLTESDAKTKLILTDSVFSMDGDLAPLPQLYELAERHDAWLVIDDAHGFGVLGRQGRGSLDHFGLPASPRIVLMGTFGKAAGVAGAFVAGHAQVIEWLINTARTYIFTTAAAPALSCALLKSLELIAAGDARRAQLFSLIERYRNGVSAEAAAHGWRLADSPTAIQPLIVGDNKATLDLSATLAERGIWAPAIRPPTVPKGSARLRISLSAAHSNDDVDALLAALIPLSPCGRGAREEGGVSSGAEPALLTPPLPVPLPQGERGRSLLLQGADETAATRPITKPTLAIRSFGNGPQITLIHGWGLGSAAWAPVEAALAEHFTLNIVDLPGYGASSPQPDATIDDIADQLAELLPPRSMLLGWSLGAMVALACAARHPRKVARLVLVGANASFIQREGWAEALAPADLDAFISQLQASPEALLKRFAALIHAGDANTRANQRAMKACLADGLPADAASLAAGLALLGSADLRGHAFAADQPVLLLHGAVDPLMPVAGAERLARQLSSATLDVFDGAAHAPFASDVERFVAAVCRFAGVAD